MVTCALASACTGDGESPSDTAVPAPTTSTAPSTTTTIVPDVAVESFRSCLGDNGIEIEEVPLDATGHPRLELVMATLDFGDPATAEAVSVCSEHLEAGALDVGGDDRLRQIVVEQLHSFSRCMVDLGVEDFPEPLPGFVGVGSPFPVAEIPYADPGFANAVTVCRARLLDALSDEGLDDSP